MNSNQVYRILVWSGWMRLAHWLVALSVCALTATGWLVKLTPSVAQSASEYHQLASIGLTLGLVLRLWLLFFGPAPAHWKSLVPKHTDHNKTGMMLRFYVTGGKSPLPKWYAHNPLWAPVYLVILLILALQTITGLLMESYPLMLGFYLPSVHDFWAWGIQVFVFVHIIAVVLHDVKGKASDVSAIINGHRIFAVEEVEDQQTQNIQTVSLDKIKKSP